MGIKKTSKKYQETIRRLVFPSPWTASRSPHLNRTVPVDITYPRRDMRNDRTRPRWRWAGSVLRCVCQSASTAWGSRTPKAVRHLLLVAAVVQSYQNEVATKNPPPICKNKYITVQK